MAVVFGNLFLNKHIHVPGRVMDEAAMKAEALRVFAERNGANTPAKLALYGAIKPPASTLIVVTESEKQRILADAQVKVPAAAGGACQIDISGAILTPKATTTFGSLFAEEDTDYANFGTLSYSATGAGVNWTINHFVSFVPAAAPITQVKLSKHGMAFTV